ncbi:hypothetical protein L195_g047361 [Trifolium pratense]|uniref:Uncharacterized protein n=1 Tax=Trifolium pratense TaxID=57577 RepID=A0A2K3MK86_TRIPR|nr:hypothetical protein L195_g047361 [Trifolium pratense]
MANVMPRAIIASTTPSSSFRCNRKCGIQRRFTVSMSTELRFVGDHMWAAEARQRVMGKRKGNDCHSSAFSTKQDSPALICHSCVNVNIC